MLIHPVQYGCETTLFCSPTGIAILVTCVAFGSLFWASIERHHKPLKASIQRHQGIHWKASKYPLEGIKGHWKTMHLKASFERLFHIRDQLEQSRARRQTPRGNTPCNCSAICCL
ncbi:hypothetical protein DUNSADRAFT_5635 [Dunaliella salina]|uniref:Encoded protein n=1 Tax=Dunaliella salina TaxID=3046 RepID=A0ABQ7GPX5_DUNSA|nr:hypothetical protein DUNSADRAFT_5635 [Dunaliella salina]|eukprot:KAF5836641.1 hypothetical protein DUNSADRAFT_5635 [Dunaliella salina]